MLTVRTLVLGALLWLAAAASARADSGYEGDDLSLRFASAFTRFSEVSAFGGATVANRWSAAMNPATTGWPRGEERYRAVLAGYWSSIELDAGSTIDVYGETGVLAVDGAGAFQLIASQIRSDREPDLTGLVLDYETDTFQAQWGHRWGRFGAGLSFNYAESELTQSAGPLTVRDSSAETYRLRAGALWEPACCWLVGAVVEHTSSPFEFTAVVSPGFPPVVVSGTDTQTQDLVRVGVSRSWCRFSTLSLDYEYGRFENDTGVLETHRVGLGVQQQLLRLFFLRGQVASDQHGNVTYGLGLSAALGRHVMLEAAWIVDALPELEPDFGGSETFQLVGSIRF
jgi:hypothetical protein